MLRFPSAFHQNNTQMPDHKRIYEEDAANYQLLISREDYQDNLKTALGEIISWENLDVVDLGSGTGRLAMLLAPLAQSMIALDLSSHMLEVAASRLSVLDPGKWLAAASDHRALPLQSQSADLVVSGWSFCYLAVWEETNWQSSLDRGLAEIQRILRPNGTTIIIESLGTGVEHPQRPDKLELYFQYLENKGFQGKWLRTDYQFDDQDQAEELVNFFFGEEMVPAIQPGTSPILPECTGIWWKS